MSYKSNNSSFPSANALPFPESKELYLFDLNALYEEDVIILSAVIKARAKVSAPPI